MVPVRVPGCVAVDCCRTTSTFSPRAWLRIWPKVGIAGQVDGEDFERPLDGGVAVVADGGDVAAAQVLQHHALEQVVDVLDGEGQVDAGVALDLALALEVADAAGEQHHLRDRQLRLAAGWALPAAASPVGWCRRTGTAKKPTATAAAPARQPNRSALRRMGSIPPLGGKFGRVTVKTKSEQIWIDSLRSTCRSCPHYEITSSNRRREQASP